MKGALLCAAIVLTPAAAYADDAARAAQSFSEARAAYDRGDFTTAAVGFEQAAAYKAHPGALLNASAAWEEAGDLARATAACDRALALSAAHGTIAEQAKACIARLLPKVATLSVKGPPSWRLRIDDLEPLPLPLQKRLTPGEHEVVELRGDGSVAASKHVRLSAGEMSSLIIDEPHPAFGGPPAVETPRKKRAVPATSVVAWSVGAVSLVASAVFGARALQAKNSYDDLPTREAQKDFYTSRDVCNVTLGVGLAAVLAGTILYLSRGEER